MSTFNETGIAMDRYAVILQSMLDAGIEKWGAAFTAEEDTWEGWLFRDIALKVDEINRIVQGVYDSRTVANAEGVILEDLLELLGIFKTHESYTTVTLTLTATKPTTVPAGSRYKTSSTEVIFATDTDLVFTAAGSDTVEATCTTAGSIDVGAGDVDTIVTSVYGISGVTNVAAAIPGADQQSDASIKEEHTSAVATSGDDDIASIKEAVNAVDGVSACYATDNDKDVTVDGIPAHNIYVSVYGGTDADIAEAIHYNKVSSVPTYGTESSVVYNPTTKQSKTINFNRAIQTDTYITFTITTIASVFPDDGEDQIKEAISTMYDSIDINDNVVYSKIYNAIYSVAGIDTVTLLKLGTAPAPAGTTDLVSTPLIWYTIDTGDITITVA